MMHLRLQRLVRHFGRIVVVALVMAPLVNASVADATFPGSNGRIAMAFYGGCSIATMRPDGTGFRGLSECGSVGRSTYAPEWSPEGRRLLFLLSGRPAIMRADGTRRRTVPLAAEPPFGLATPAFAPDGRHFAYTRSTRHGSRSEIWVATVNGRENRRLRGGWSPRWSPGGRTIAAALSNGWWLVNARTGRRIRWLAGNVGQVDWSPNGRRLVYSATGPAFDRDLFIVRADGKGQPRRLTRGGGHENQPVWSPDGRRIAFVRWDSGEVETLQFSIWSMRLRDRKRRQIYATPPFPIEEFLDPPTLSWQARAR